MTPVTPRFGITLAAVFVLGLSQTALAQTPVYSCQGFESPFNLPISLTNKANRAIPLKAQLFDTTNNVVTSASPFGAAPPVVTVSFSSTPTSAVDTTSLLAPLGSSSSGNQFNFDPTTYTWWFNLGTTPFSAAGTYTVSLQSGDATQYKIVDSCSAACQASYDRNVGLCRAVYDPILAELTPRASRLLFSNKQTASAEQ